MSNSGNVAHIDRDKTQLALEAASVTVRVLNTRREYFLATQWYNLHDYDDEI